MTNTAPSRYYIEDMIESAHAASRLQDHAAALDLYRQAFDLWPDHETLACDVAGRLIHLKRDDEARAVLRYQLARWPRSRPAILQMLDIAERQGDLPQALDWLEAALALPRVDPSLISRKIHLLMRLGHTARARALIDSLLQRDPEDVAALVERGHIATSCADHQAALDFYTRALACVPDHPTLPCDIAHHLAELGRVDEAEALLATRSAAGHGAGFAWRQRARLASHRGDHQTAADLFGIASSLLPQDDGLRLDMAQAQAALGRFDEAHALLDAIGDGIEPAVLLNARAHFTAWQGDKARAQALWHEGIAAAPLRVECTISLVHALIEDGAHAQAFRVLDDALSVQPDNVEFAVAKADCYVGIGQLQDALDILERLQTQWRDASFLLEKLIRCKLAVGAKSNAETLLQDHPSFASNANASFFLRLRAIVAMARYRFPETLEIASKLLSRCPSDIEMLVLQTNLAFVLGDYEAFHASRERVQTLRDCSASLEDRIAARNIPFMIHLVNETCFSSVSAARVARAYWTSSSPKLSMLSDILQSEPDNISAAISTLVAMRCDGLLTPQAAPPARIGARQKVPRKIFQFWDKPNPPEAISSAMKSWPAACVGYEHDLFDDERARTYLRTHFDTTVQKAFDMSKKAAARSDLMRLALLYNEGGVYADADDLCLSDVSDWFAGDVEFVIPQEASGALLNCFIAAAPRHAFMAHALERIAQAMIERSGDSVWYTSGTGILTRLFCQFYGNDLRAGRVPKGVRILDFYELGRHVSPFAVKHYKKTSDHWLHRDNG